MIITEIRAECSGGRGDEKRFRNKKRREKKNWSRGFGEMNIKDLGGAVTD